MAHGRMEISFLKYLVFWIKYALRRRRNRLRILENPLKNLNINKVESVLFKELQPAAYAGELDLSFVETRTHVGITGWLKLKRFMHIPLRQRFVHFHHPVVVFQENSYREKFFGGYNDLQEAIELLKINSAYVTTRAFPENLSKYRCSVWQMSTSTQPKVSSRFVDSALVLDIGGGEFFQHFVLDLLPVLNGVRDFLINNPSVKILLPRPLPTFRNFQSWMDLLNLENEVVFFPSDKSNLWYIDNLYFANILPFNYGANSSVLYQYLHKTIAPNHPNEIPNSVIYIRRNTPNLARGYVVNEEETISHISSLCAQASIPFGTLDPTTADLSYIRQTLGKSKLAITLHGGAGLNAILLPSGSTFVEAINTVNCNTFAHLMLSSGINYVPLSNNYQHYDSKIQFPLNDLEKLLERHAF